MIARAADLTDELPRFLRLEKIRPMRMLVGAGAVLVLFMALLAGEALFVGPNLGTRGAGGWLVPAVLGFRAQPMQAFDVDSGESREVLYLGGNADLYVLVDPCNDDTVEFVSVGVNPPRRDRRGHVLGAVGRGPRPMTRRSPAPTSTSLGGRHTNDSDSRPPIESGLLHRLLPSGGQFRFVSLQSNHDGSRQGWPTTQVAL